MLVMFDEDEDEEEMAMWSGVSDWTRLGSLGSELWRIRRRAVSNLAY